MTTLTSTMTTMMWYDAKKTPTAPGFDELSKSPRAMSPQLSPVSTCPQTLPRQILPPNLAPSEPAPRHSPVSTCPLRALLHASQPTEPG